MSKQPSRKYFEFEERFKTAIREAEQDTGIHLPALETLIRSQGGLHAAKQLLANRERFSAGFKLLAERDLLKHSVEQLAVEFSESGLFTASEIETARWRLTNSDLAQSDQP